MQQYKLLLTLCIFFMGLLSACQADYTPKPKAYPRMEFPDKAYENYQNQDCPFAFDIPVYANIDQKPFAPLAGAEDRCWMNVVFSDLNAQFHLSYKEINSEVKLAQLVEDAHKLTSKHIKKAEYIDQRTIATQKDTYGLFSDVGGNAASSMQFYLTDSTNHFLFGSLYFASTPNYDSIQPAIQFIKKDMLHLIESFEWKEDLAQVTASR